MNALFPLIAVLLWSINAVVNKLSAGVIAPGAISFYRWLVALLVLTPFILPTVIRNRHTIKPYWFKLLILGLLGMVLYQSLAYYAAQTISALMIGILNSLIPLLTLLISLFILRIVPTVGLAIGGTLSFAGIIWLISSGHPAQLLHEGINRGEVLMLIASAAYALYGVLVRKWQIELPTWQSLYMQITFGVILLLPNFILTALYSDVSLNMHSLPMVLYAGIAASIFGPMLWLIGMKSLGANKTSNFMNLMPLFTAIIAIVFLHETLHAYHIIGGGIALLGVILAQKLNTPLYHAEHSRR